jgi:oligopeptide/dipeptide ABC transporter ATP-binding protein
MTAPSQTQIGNEVLKKPLLEIAELTIRFSSRAGMFKRGPDIQAVTQASLTIQSGETLALVGESGSGKTTLVRSILDLVPITKGVISFHGARTDQMTQQERREMRQRVQFIFQDPFGSLNPRLTVRDLIAEPLVVHRMGTSVERAARVDLVMKQVGLPNEYASRYPHQFSGGQRQRIAIARALVSSPELIIADEPLSALDVSIQSQILNLLTELKTQLGVSYLLVSHDLNAVHHLADRVAVMYLGRIVEAASKDLVFTQPSHPYTVALMQSMPKLGAGKRIPGQALRGEIPSPLAPPSGCAFHPRCSRATAHCQKAVPVLRHAALGRQIACHHPLEV